MEISAKESKDLRKDLEFIPDYEYGTRIFVIAVANEECLNDHLRIPTISGVPICEEVHDLVRDCYYTLGVSWHDLGEIPVSFRVTLPGIIGWESNFPIPSEMLAKYLNSSQKKDLERWGERYGDGYTIKYLQIRSVY
jgi:hypothetical protein